MKLGGLDASYASSRPNTAGASVEPMLAGHASTMHLSVSKTLEKIGVTPHPPTMKPPQQQQQPADAMDVMSAKFRSIILQLEIALREMIADSADTAPSEARVKRVFHLYDSMIAAVPTTTADLLRMFRVEFCRAIFSPVIGSNGKISSVNAVDSASHVPYFDRFDTLLRENNMLSAEVAAAERATNTDQLQHQVTKLQSLGSYYEHEIQRLTKDNDRLREEVDRMTIDAELTAQNNQKVFVALDESNHKLAKESRELQLQVFRLKKEARDQVAGYNLYYSLRTAKMEELDALWTAGDENASLVATLHQLEAVLNGVLTGFEHTIIKSSAGEIAASRSKFVRDVQYVLDEYHEVHLRRCAIEAIDHGKGAEPVDQKSDAWRERTTIESRGSSVVARARQIDSNALSSPRLRGKAASTHPATAVAKGDSRRWGEVMFGSALGSKIHSDPLAAISAWDPKMVVKKDGCVPLFETGGDRFMSALDLYVAAGGGDYECHKSMGWADPSVGIELPAKTTHVKIKYQNPMVKDPTRNFGAEDAGRLEAMAKGELTRRWLPNGAAGAETAETIGGTGEPKALLQPQDGSMESSTAAIEEAGASAGVDGKDAAAKDDVAFGDSHWLVFRERFAAYRPFLCRSMSVELIDTVMYRTFNVHRKHLRDLYDRVSSIAATRSAGPQMQRVVTDRLFRDEYDSLSLQRAFFDVLEALFVFPEIVMKVGYELLTSMESLALAGAHPHMRVYIGCLGAVVAPPMGRMLAMTHTMLAQFWPLASKDRDVAVSESDLLAVLRGVYPTEGAVRVNLAEMVTEVMLACDGVVTLESVKRHFTDAFLHLSEPVISKCHESVVFKTALVHWAELDLQNFWEAVRTLCSEDAHEWIAVLHLASCCVYDRQGRLPPEELSHIAAEVIWTETGRHRPDHR
jgi:hypothetical protein